MNNLITILRNLPREGKRLPNGLALRLSKGNGVFVLGCSRVDVPPSDAEMQIIARAVQEAFMPPLMYKGGRPSVKAVSGQRGRLHHICRLYWLEEDVTVVKLPVQMELFQDKE